MLILNEVYSLDSNVLYFDEHSYSYTLEDNISHICRPLDKRSLNSSISNWLLKNTQVIGLKLES